MTIFRKSAQEISESSDSEIQEIVHSKIYQSYKISIENKNLRLILRGIEEMEANYFVAKHSSNMQ